MIAVLTKPRQIMQERRLLRPGAAQTGRRIHADNDQAIANLVLVN